MIALLSDIASFNDEYIEEEEYAQRKREKVGKMGKFAFQRLNRWNEPDHSLRKQEGLRIFLEKPAVGYDIGESQNLRYPDDEKHS